jgi:hypothetical protein
MRDQEVFDTIAKNMMTDLDPEDNLIPMLSDLLGVIENVPEKRWGRAIKTLAKHYGLEVPGSVS